jgi:hypothetical protein
MFYLTGTNATYGSVNISNGANVTFSGPTSGPYTGGRVLSEQSDYVGRERHLLRRRQHETDGHAVFSDNIGMFSNGSSVSNVYTAIVAKQVSFTGGTSLQYDATGH